MTQARRLPKRFAPLDPARKNDSDAPLLQGIVFDVDGTLCKPQSYMFAQMRTHLHIPKTVDILAHIHSLPEPARSEAHTAIRAIETAAMEKQEPQEGLETLMGYLEMRGVRLGICTRNFDTPVSHLLQTHLPTTTFSPIITRSFHPPKPHPAGILHIARTWNLPSAENLIMVGDSLDDMVAGYTAGAATVLLENEDNGECRGREETGLCVRRLDELVGVLEGGLVEGR